MISLHDSVSLKLHLYATYLLCRLCLEGKHNCCLDYVHCQHLFQCRGCIFLQHSSFGDEVGLMMSWRSWGPRFGNQFIGSLVKVGSVKCGGSKHILSCVSIHFWLFRYRLLYTALTKCLKVPQQIHKHDLYDFTPKLAYMCKLLRCVTGGFG